MSSIIVVRTSLGNVNIDILKKALEVIGYEGLEIRDYIVDYYDQKHNEWGGNKIIGAVFTAELRRGVGVSIDKNGRLLFVSHESGRAFEKMKSKIEKIYKLIAVIAELQAMGYGVSLLQDEEKLTILKGELSSKEITFTVDDNGGIIFDLDGFKGKACLQEVEKLTEMLKEQGVNLDVKNVQLKSEDRDEPPPKQVQRGRN